MDRDYKSKYNSLLRRLKKRINLEAKRNLKFDLKHFTILSKGELFRNSYSWKLLDFINDSYVLSLKNSYEIEVSGVLSGASPGVISHVEYPQIAILIKSNLIIPNLSIRPFYLNEKIANAFLNFDVKLKNRNNFNKKYVLESKAEIDNLEIYLSEELTTKIEEYEGFSLEVIDSNILLKFERDITFEKAMVLYDLANVLDKKILNHSVI